MVFPLLLSLAALAAAGLGANAWAERRLMRPSPRYPRPPNPAAAPGGLRLVCAGDSLTHGNLSADYVAPLAARLAPRGLAVFNAGINADLAETLLARLDDIIAARPDFVTVLVGSNDVNATMRPADLRQYRRLGKLRGPEPPSAATFETNLTAIVRRLRAETTARVALLSLPPMSEDLAHVANQRADRYSQIIRDVAQAEGVAYLPLRERLLAELRRHPGRPRIRFEQTTRLVRLALLRHYLLRQSWDQIAAANGCHFLTDNLHLNTPAAAIIEQLMSEWVTGEAG